MKFRFQIPTKLDSNLFIIFLMTGSSRTLPKPPKPKLVELGSGASSTASSRKSSNTSSNSSQSCSGCSNCCCENEQKYEISQEALNEIAAFGTFLEQFHQRQQTNQQQTKTSPNKSQQVSTSSEKTTNISHKPPIQQRKPNNSKTLERQQKIQDN